VRLVWIIEGIFWCAYKGFKALVHLPRGQAKEHLWIDCWGWSGPMIDNQNRDIWAEQTTLPRGGKSHHRTDLIVEHNRLNPQRGAKLLCMFSAVMFFVGIALGAAI